MTTSLHTLMLALIWQRVSDPLFQVTTKLEAHLHLQNKFQSWYFLQQTKKKKKSKVGTNIFYPIMCVIKNINVDGNGLQFL